MMKTFIFELIETAVIEAENETEASRLLNNCSEEIIFSEPEDSIRLVEIQD